MKRVKKSPIEPAELVAYKQNHPVGTPEHDWDYFARNRTSDKRAVQKQIRLDQRGLCAYCEIDLMEVATNSADGQGAKADFQVEHFHEKCDKNPLTRPSPDCDWGLWWPNLYGCCMGGAEKTLVDQTRVARGKGGQHCGQKKLRASLSTDILDPAQIPASPCLFSDKVQTNEDGIELVVNVTNCNMVAHNVAQKAQASLDKLNLNCSILKRHRREAIRKVFFEIAKEMQAGKGFDDAIKNVIERLFDSSAKSWPPFFTTIRTHFGGVVEERLWAINYDG